MITLEDLTPSPEEMLFVCGRRGTGKTTLLKKIFEPLATREPVVIIDSKPDKKAFQAREWWQTWKHDPYQTLRTFDMRRLQPGLYVYRPSYPAWADPHVSRIILTAMKRKPKPKGNDEPVISLVFDEFANFAKGGRAMPALEKGIREGRSVHVRMGLGTQRPAGVPLLGITEAVKYCCFRLTSIDDRRRMAQWVDPAMLEKPGPGPRDFWAKDDNADAERVYLVHQ